MGVKIRERRKGSGIWWIFIDYKKNKRAQKVGRDRRLATELAKRIEYRLALEGKKFFEKAPTFSEYVDGWKDKKGEFYPGWFDKVAKLSLKNSTSRSYRLIIDRYLIPTFGPKRLNEISSRDIADFINKRISQGMKSRTAKNIKNCLSAILRYAVNPDEYIATNPARGVTIPKPEDETSAREPDPLTWDERDHLEETFGNHFPGFLPLVICGFRTGLRIGELLALKWEDIDFHERMILVQRNITRGKITSPKSRSSKRHVRMTNQLTQILKSHRTALKQGGLKKGKGIPSEWIFPNSEGDPLNYGNFIHRTWNRAMEKSGLRRRTPHDMRHTYATLRLSKGDSLAEVSKEMGHSTTDITYRTYYKWLPKESRSDINELDGLREFGKLRQMGESSFL